jgi:hypothetical protein
VAGGLSFSIWAGAGLAKLLYGQFLSLAAVDPLGRLVLHIIGPILGRAVLAAKAAGNFCCMRWLKTGNVRYRTFAFD